MALPLAGSVVFVQSLYVHCSKRHEGESKLGSIVTDFWRGKRESLGSNSGERIFVERNRFMFSNFANVSFFPESS